MIFSLSIFSTAAACIERLGEHSTLGGLGAGLAWEVARPSEEHQTNCAMVVAVLGSLQIVLDLPSPAIHSLVDHRKQEAVRRLTVVGHP